VILPALERPWPPAVGSNRSREARNHQRCQH
jgi:hypothetical protein